MWHDFNLTLSSPSLPPVSLIIKTTFDSDSLRSAVSGLRDNLLGAMDRVDASTISGFMTSYGFLCDFFGVPFNHEIAWVS